MGAQASDANDATLIRCGRLHDLTAPGVAELVADAEATGARFIRRLVSEWHDGSNRFDRRGEALFGAWLDNRLAGVCGLNIDPYAGDDRIGRVRHLYVVSAVRSLGVGRSLVGHVVDAARGRFTALRLRTTNPLAARVYEALGFGRVSGDDCTHVLVIEAPGDGRASRAYFGPTNPT